jgi:hypothetical protein
MKNMRSKVFLIAEHRRKTKKEGNIYWKINRLHVNYVSIWRSWIHASWYYYENKQQYELCRLVYYFRSALHFSGDIFAHHQEHLAVFTVSGIVRTNCCRLVSQMSWKLIWDTSRQQLRWNLPNTVSTFRVCKSVRRHIFK